MSTTAAGPIPLEERSAILMRVLQSDTGIGWRVESQTPTSAQLVKGKHTNHILHLILTILTFGLWVIVWIIVAITGGEKHRYVTVDEYGNVTRR